MGNKHAQFRRLLAANGDAIGFLNVLARQTNDKELEQKIVNMVIHLMQESASAVSQWEYGEDEV